MTPHAAVAAKFYAARSGCGTRRRSTQRARDSRRALGTLLAQAALKSGLRGASSLWLDARARWDIGWMRRGIVAMRCCVAMVPHPPTRREHRVSHGVASPCGPARRPLPPLRIRVHRAARRTDGVNTTRRPGSGPVAPRSLSVPLFPAPTRNGAVSASMRQLRVLVNLACVRRESLRFGPVRARTRWVRAGKRESER